MEGEHSSFKFARKRAEADPANPGQSIQIKVEPVMIFDHVLFRPDDKALGQGSRATDVPWDGVTCSTPKQNILLPSESSTLEFDLPIELGNGAPLTQIQLSVWLKNAKSTTNLGNSKIIQLLAPAAENGAPAPYLGIEIQENELRCTLFKESVPYQSVVYTAYETTSTKWMHITCSFDGSGGQGLPAAELEQLVAKGASGRDTSKQVLQGQLYVEG